MTIAKLQDLKYHLSQLQNMKGVVDGRPNLVAFLAAGRTLTLVMQDEYKHKEGFEKWYGQKQEEMGNNSLARFFKTKRDEALHSSQSPKSIQIKVEFPKGFEIKAGEKTFIPMGTVNDHGGIDFDDSKDDGGIRTMDMILDDSQTEPTIKLCSDFFNYLSDLVTECDSKFDS